MKDIATVEEAAELLGLTPQYIRRLASLGKIEGRRLGREWVLSRSSVLSYRARREAETRKDSTPG